MAGNTQEIMGNTLGMLRLTPWKQDFFYVLGPYPLATLRGGGGGGLNGFS